MSAVCCLVSRIAINSISFLYLTLHSKNKQWLLLTLSPSQQTTSDICPKLLALYVHSTLGRPKAI